MQSDISFNAGWHSLRQASRWLRLSLDLTSFWLRSQEYIGRNVRKKAKPFGGIQVCIEAASSRMRLTLKMQLIVSGDFFQLPPVPDHVNGVPVPPTFAFDAKSWYRCLGRPVVLNQVFRQKDNGKLTTLIF